MSPDNAIALAIAIGILAYLVVALIYPEDERDCRVSTRLRVGARPAPTSSASRSMS